jgi:PAS domain S-box-containing protein
MPRRSSPWSVTSRRVKPSSTRQFTSFLPIALAHLDITFDRKGSAVSEKLSDWNKAAEQLTGIKARSLIGKSIGRLIGDKALDSLLDQIKNIVRTGKSNHLNGIQLVGKRSRSFDLSLWKTDCGVGILLNEPVDDDFSQSVDILDSITDAFFLLDNEWRFAYLSPKSEELLTKIDIRIGDLIGKNLWDRLPDSKESRGYHELMRALQEKTALEFEEYFEPLKTWFEVHAHPIGTGLAVYVKDITRRKLAETAFLKLSNAVEQSGDAVFVTAVDGTIEYVNPAFETMTGFLRSEALGKTPRILRSQDHDEPFFKQMWDQVLSGDIFRATLTNRRKDGRLLYVEETITPVKDEHGTITHFVASLRDVTERKQSEERFKALIEHSSDAIALLDKDGIVVYTGPSTGRILGYEGEDFTGRMGFNFIHPDERNDVHNAFQSLTKHPGKIILLQYRMRHRDGTWKWIEATANNLLGEPNIHSVVVNYRDISGRKVMEEALRKSEIEYRNLFDRANDAIFIFEPQDETILETNERACQLYGFSKDELLGMSLKKITKDIARGEQEIHDLLRHKSSRNFETVHFDKNNQPMEMLVNSSVVEYAGRTAIMSIIRDITELRRLEHQLRQAQKMESVGTLAGGVAHDFNNILSIILGYTSIIRRGRIDPSKFNESVDTITKAAQRGATLVKQILTFARKTDVVFESVKVNDLLADIVKLLGETFPKTIEFKIDADRTLPTIVADINQLHQVFLNLSVNARDAMPKGGTITLSTEMVQGLSLQGRFPEARQSEYVHISVADSGTGMDEQTRSRIFEPFFTTKGQGSGTGLGLAVVYGIVNSHHGFIEVFSKPGKGTSFHLYFPVQMRRLEVLAKDLEGAEPIPGGVETILVVEDELMLQSLVKDLLQNHGYQVQTASDGAEAVEMYQRLGSEIDLVLTDIGLPKLNGWDVCRKIIALNPKAKVLVASGYIDPSAKSNLKDSAAKGFIHKPYLPDDIVKRIREVLDLA